MLYSILYDIFILSETIFAIDVENGVKVPRRIGFDGIMTFLGGYAGYAVAMFIAYYLLRSFGLYRMAKARGLENPKMCFVPFYAFIMLSRLRSDCNALKKHKFYPIVAISALGAFLLFSIVLDSFFSLRIISQLVETERIAPGTAVLTEEMFAYNTNLANVLSNLTDVSKIVYMVFVALLYCDLFRTYSPLRTRTHLTLSVIFTVLTGSSLLYGAFTLSLSGRSAVNFDEILAKRKIYYGYGNPGNPYARPPYSDGGNASGSFGEDRSDPSQDPFSDFADTNKNSRSDDPFGEFSGGSTQGKTNSDDPFADFGSDNGYSGKNSDNSRDGKPYDGKSDDDTDSLF